MERSSQRVVFGCAFAVSAGMASAPAWAKVTTKSGQDYINECEQEGVPIPEVVDITGGNGWVKKGNLRPDFVGETENLGPAEVYYWTHPDESVCIALPREVKGDPNLFSAIGVICQGKTSGKACFLDTTEKELRSQGVYNIQRPGMRDFVGGIELQSSCTSCHVGRNAFIVHPGLSAAQTGDPTGFGSLGDAANPMIPFLAPNKYYEPIHPAKFPSNPPPSTLACGGCHGPMAPYGAFPELSRANAIACDIMLWTVGEGDAASAKTMPPGNRPIPNSMLAEYNALRAACGKMPVPDRNPALKNMSFDAPDKWVPSLGTTSLNKVTFTEGIGATSVNASGYVNLSSVPMESWFLPQIGDQMKVEVYVPPAGQPNPNWLGAVQAYITIPGTWQVNQYLGQVELTPGGTGWRTATFSIPSAIKASLLTQQTGIRFGIGVNTPNGSPPVLLDNLRFAGALVPGPSAPPRGKFRYEFEQEAGWPGNLGIVQSNQASSAVGGFNTPQSLRVNLAATGTEGRVFVKPNISPQSGTTVSYRVFIPGGTPVTAIQPYFMDGNWAWTAGWYPNLPQDAWVTLTVNVPATAFGQFNELGIKIYTSRPFNGPIYLDAIEY